MSKKKPKVGLDADQAAHDRRMAAMSDEDMNKLARNLGDLMRAKEQGSEAPATPEPKRRSGGAVVGSFTEADYEMARALGWM